VNKNYIGGEWVAAAEVNFNISPSDSSNVAGEYARADADQAGAAVDAFFDVLPVWRKFTVEQRSESLDRICTEVLAHREELDRLLAREEGKTLAQDIGEVGRVGRVFKFFAGESLRSSGERSASIRPGAEVDA